MPVDVDTLRRLFRNLEDFHILVQETGIYVIPGEDDGEEWSYFDLLYLFEQSQIRLPGRQAQAIRFFLVGQQREEDVAVMMGLKPTNPIGMYATTGLERIVSWIEEGELPRYKAEASNANALRDRQGIGGRGGRAA